MVTLVTGANGFVGTALCAQPYTWQAGIDTVQVGNRPADTDWSIALQGVEQVAHLAARVHVMNEHSADPLAEFRCANVKGMLPLEREAAANSVRRFVYLSSIKGNGEAKQPSCPFAAYDTPAPEDLYGRSKHEAEQVLEQVTADIGMEVVIIRPPLVYGPGVKANFAEMMRWLPRVTANYRSLVALDNLVDFIVTCQQHAAAAGRTFLASDGEDLSTDPLMRRMGAAQGWPRLLPALVGLLRLGATLVGKQGGDQRLYGSPQLDITATREMLCWTLPISVDEGLRRVAQGVQA